MRRGWRGARCARGLPESGGARGLVCGRRYATGLAWGQSARRGWRAADVQEAAEVRLACDAVRHAADVRDAVGVGLACATLSACVTRPACVTWSAAIGLGRADAAVTSYRGV